MKLIKRASLALIILICALVLIVTKIVSGSGNAVYLAQTSAGANDGTSCAAAKAYTYFNSSGNWSGSPTGILIGPDTTVHLCGNITGTGGTNSSALTFQGSGSSGHPITLVFETGATMTAVAFWGTAINLGGQHDLLINGGTACGSSTGGSLPGVSACNGTISNTGNGTGLSTSSHSTFIASSGGPCTNCEIKNIALINNYIHIQCETSSGCDTSNAGTTENAVITFNSGGAGIKFHDNVVHDCSWCVNFQMASGDTNLLIYNNNIYNCAHGLAVYGGITAAGPVNVYNNNIHDYQSWDTGTVDAYHEDGIHAFGNDLAEINIYNNQWSTQSLCCITGEIFLEQGSSWTNAGIFRIFNNIFLQSVGAVNGLVQPYIGTSAVYLNNTIVGPGPSGSTNTALFTSGTNVKFNNNVISSFPNLINLNANIGTTFASVATDMDYQAYGDTGGFNSWVGLGADTGSFATWKTNCMGCDTHSSYNASLNLNANGTPSASSTSIVGQGRNLTSLCSGALTLLCYDIFGTARPSSGAWDMGAAQLTGPPSGSSMLGATKILGSSLYH